MGEMCGFRDSAFYKDVPDKLLKFVRIEYRWNATKSTPNFTGITPHVTLMYDTDVLRCKFDALRLDIKGDMEDMID